MEKEKIRSIIKALRSSIIEYPFSAVEHRMGLVISLQNLPKASINGVVVACDNHKFFEITKTELQFFNPKVK